MGYVDAGVRQKVLNFDGESLFFLEEIFEFLGVLESELNFSDFPFFEVHLRDKVLPKVGFSDFERGGHNTTVVD